MAERHQNQSSDPSREYLESQVVELGASLAAKEERLSNRFKEITALTTILRDEEAKNERLWGELRWIIEVKRRISASPRWWAMLPRSSRRKRERQLLKKAGLFDSSAYFEMHPDVAASGMDALDHYLLYGIDEGRSRTIHWQESPGAAGEKEDAAKLLSSGRFDPDWYASSYPDVAQSLMAPAAHYLSVGARLGRSPAPPGTDRVAGDKTQLSEGSSGPLQISDGDIDALFIDGTNGTSSTGYRVYRIASGLAGEGWAVRWVKGDDLAALLERDVRPRLVVFHRAPFSTTFAEVARHMRARGATIVFDVDDLIFDETLIPQIAGFRELSSSDKDGFLRGVRAYREFVLYADYCTAPTRFLAERIRKLGKRAYRVRNAISVENIRFFEEAGYRRAARPSPFVIGYYSGTKTHQADFAVVAPALAQFMSETPDAIFRLVGDFNLDDYPQLAGWQQVKRRGDLPRVTRVGLMPHDAMIRDQLSCDLIIAPLEVGNAFCEAKSELKFFEASLASCPVIASPTQTFVEATEEGELAILATTTEEWLAAFRSTFENYEAALRRSKAAFDRVRDRYSQAFAAREALNAYEEQLAGRESPSITPQASL